jgi:hypothetical protein
VRSDKNLKIPYLLWLRFSDDLAAVYVRKSCNNAAIGTVQCHEAEKRKPHPSSTSTSVETRGFTCSVQYCAPLFITKEKKVTLLDMCKYLPNEYIP